MARRCAAFIDATAHPPFLEYPVAFTRPAFFPSRPWNSTSSTTLPQIMLPPPPQSFGSLYSEAYSTSRHRILSGSPLRAKNSSSVNRSSIAPDSTVENGVPSWSATPARFSTWKSSRGP